MNYGDWPFFFFFVIFFFCNIFCLNLPDVCVCGDVWGGGRT